MHHIILLGGVILALAACSPFAGLSTIDTATPNVEAPNALREVSAGSSIVNSLDFRDLRTDLSADSELIPEILKIIDDNTLSELLDKQAKSVNLKEKRLVAFGDLRKDEKFASITQPKDSNRVLQVSMTGTFIVPVFAGGPGELVPKAFSQMDIVYNPETGENLGVVISP